MSARRQATRALAAACSLTLLGHAGSAHGYCRTTTCKADLGNPAECAIDANGCAERGVALYWPSRCVPLAVNEKGSPLLGISAAEAETLVLGAASRWTRADCNGRPPSVTFVDQGIVECGLVEYNAEGPNANVVLFRDTGWEHDPLDLALTTVTFDVTDGKIHGADIELNSELIRQGYSDHVGTIMTHEIGHVLGLAHSAVPGALMNADYAANGITIATDDDEEGVCAVYPPGLEIPACDARKGFDSRCGGAVEGSCGIGRRVSRAEEPPALLAFCCVLLGGAVRRRRTRARRSRLG
jgi:hypothetical protein